MERDVLTLITFCPTYQDKWQNKVTEPLIQSNTVNGNSKLMLYVDLLKICATEAVHKILLKKTNASMKRNEAIPCPADEYTAQATVHYLLTKSLPNFNQVREFSQNLQLN